MAAEPVHIAYIAFGSSCGNREAYIAKALRLLEAVKGITITNVSPVYESTPLGNAATGNFLNGCLRAETLLTPEQLLIQLKQVEAATGRTARKRWADREIDLDIVFYDELVLHSEQLTVPHPEAHLRDFVLLPLADLAPEYLHPVLKKSVRELLHDNPAGLVTGKVTARLGAAPNTNLFTG